MHSDSIQVKTLQNRVAALSQQVESERGRLASEGGSDLTRLIDGYSPLLLEQELAQHRYSSALASLEVARADAQRKQRYLIPFVKPALPDEATEPERAMNTLIVFLAAGLIYGIGALMLASVYDHMGSMRILADSNRIFGALVLVAAGAITAVQAADSDAEPRSSDDGMAASAWACRRARKRKVRPFGEKLFEGGFQGEREDGLNPDYRVRPGDHITLRMWGAVEHADVVVVDAQGNIFVPDIGPIRVAGIRNGDLAARIRKAVATVFTQNVNVYTNLEGTSPVVVYVTGYVKAPGSFAGVSSDSLLYFLSRAGGVDPRPGKLPRGNGEERR